MMMLTRKKSKKNCIFLLTRGYTWRNLKSYNWLIGRNRLIASFLKSQEAVGKGWTNFKLIAFHEGNISIFQQFYIDVMSGIKTQYIDISQDFKLEPSHAWRSQPEQLLSYSLMCHFHYKHVWKYLAEYNLISRVDEDVLMHIGFFRLLY